MQHFLKKALVYGLAALTSIGVLAADAPKQGVVRVKLQTQVAKRVGAKTRTAIDGNLPTGVQALDAAAAKIGVASIRPLFPPNPKYAAERAKYGIDQWYEVTFDTSVSPVEARKRLQNVNGILKAETVIEPKLVGSKNFVVQKAAPKAGSTMPFNDPRLASQWHYTNDGSMPGSVAGADINLFKAWQQTTGDRKVVVAIIDGGIDYRHEDLAANVLINEAELNGRPGVDDDGNGYIDDIYGWNFCTNSATIYPHDHGTHVAGTVAAVNNNGIGVCGVAGGDGSADSGVRMISCQVFDSRSGVGDGNFAEALVYAAERGASIAQCSWGWDAPDYKEDAVIDAINYFTNMARSETMTGGLCIFATGNNGQTGNYYPGCLDNVVAVAAMSADKRVTAYSNYGPWVDITAPGGLMDYDPQWGVLSTLPNNSYGWNEGTSMACPHVSGIAALVLSKYGTEAMSPEMLRNQLLTAVNDLYSTNPGREGNYGSGYIDAVKALQFGDESAPDAVAALELLPAQSSITIRWTVPAAPYDAVDHFIVYYSTDEFTADNLGSARSVNVDSRFSPSGSQMSHTLDGLASLTKYYIAVKAVGRQGAMSELSPVVSAETNAGPAMTVDKESLDISSGSDVFTIGNDAEGLLNWTYRTRTASSSISMKSLRPVSPVNVKPYSGKIATAAVTRHKTVSTDEFMQSDYPSDITYYEFVNAYIGDSDRSLPNSMAQYFTVDEAKYPDGFNLTTVTIEGANGVSPVIEVYKGAASITAQNRLCSVTPDFFAYSFPVQLPVQQYFAPGESFWIVVHFDGNQEGYPLGLAEGDGSAAAANAYMSNDRGLSWTPLKEALAGSPFTYIECPTWAIKAISNNPDWSQLLVLTPSEGSVKMGETQTVEVKTDGQPLCNGNYSFNIYFDTNESDANSIVLPVSLNVSGQQADMVFGKIVNFGDLLVGQQRTLTVEVFNRGYGSFVGSVWGPGIYSDKISSTSEHFAGPEYLSSGFQARTKTSFDITFAPKAAGSHTGSIVFTDKDGKEFSVMVRGVATEPAQITVTPAAVEVGELEVGGESKEVSFEIANTGNYPLQFVMPKYSDETVEGGSDAAGIHRFGYVWASNLNGSTGAEYDGNPELIGAVDITSSFSDNSSWSAPIDLGFKFPFYGKEYEQVYVNNLGGIAMNTGEFAAMSQTPVYPGHTYLNGTGWISAWGASVLQMGADSHVSYAKRDGKLVISFSNVLAVVYDQDYTPVSFHIVLSSNGDIEFYYDDYDPMMVFNQGRPLYVGVSDPDCQDPLTVTSIDMANSEWATEEERTVEGDRYMSFATGTAVVLRAPAPDMIETVSPVTGLLAPGEKVTVKATVKATEDMNAGATVSNLVINSNDLASPSVLVPFNAVITGDLNPALAATSAAVDFGKVFRTSDAKRPVTVTNDGRSEMTVTAVTFRDGKFTTDFATPCTVPARHAKDIVVTLPTDAEGVVADEMTVSTDAGEMTVSLKGEVIGCPDVELGYDEITLSLEAYSSEAKPLTIKNTGNEPLQYAVTAGEHVSYKPDFATSTGTAYTYVSNENNSSVKFDWIDITSDETAEHNSFTYYMAHDYVAVDLPFDFPFYGKNYNRMYVYNTGFVSFTERTDEHAWPEPPADFPGGTIYTNIIAPYWGLHSMDQTRTAGTYHRVTEEQAVVSFMEYGNSMNLGVCYQLILNADGTFKFQYKADSKNPDSVIFNTFGLAGISNEDASESIHLPDRLVKFGSAVEFTPVVSYILEPGLTATADITVTADAMAGTYESAINVATNIPGKESITIPLSLDITGEAKAEFSGDVTVEHPVGWSSTDFTDPLIQMGAMYYGMVEIKNTGTAPFMISYVENKGPQIHDDYFDEDYPVFNTFYEAEEIDWITGEPTGNKAWTNYDNMPVMVGADGVRFAVPMTQCEQAYTPGEYEIPLVFHFEGLADMTEHTATIKFIVTPAPVLGFDGTTADEGLYIKGVAPDYVGTHALTLTNEGEYKLTGTARLDLTGRGESLDPDDGGGIAPTTAAVGSAKAVKALTDAGVRSLQPFDLSESSDDILNLPGKDYFSFIRGLYHPNLPGSLATFNYGSNTEYDLFKASTLFESPAGGFNISHVYSILKFGNLKDADIKVEIVTGDSPENGTVIGRGTYHLGTPESTNASYQTVIRLDRSVFVPEGQEFYVVFTFPAGEAAPMGVSKKEESVVTGRYMGFTESYGWYDMAEMFKEQYGSIGYITSCLETEAGSEWATLETKEVAFSVEPGETLPLNVRINAVSAPLEEGNKAMMVIKTNDPMMPLVNVPVVLDKNRTPLVEAESEALLVSEGATAEFAIEVSDPDDDAMTLSFADNGELCTVSSVTSDKGELTVADGSVAVEAGSGKVTVKVAVAPDYGDAGSYAFTVTAKDSYAQEASATVAYTVEHTNRAPLPVAAEALTLTVGQSSDVIDFAKLFNEPDGDDMTYTLTIADPTVVDAYQAAASAILVGLKAGVTTVSVEATDAAGAKSVNTIDVTVSERSGIAGITTSTDVKVWPNPVVETLYLSLPAAVESFSYRLVSINGQTVLAADAVNAQSGDAIAIDMAALPAGYYVIKITAADGSSAALPVIKR